MKLVRYVGSLNKYNTDHGILLGATLLMLSVVLIPDLNFIATEILLFVTFIWSFTILSYYPKVDIVIRRMSTFAILYFFLVLLYKILGISRATWDIAAGYYGWMFAIIVSAFSLQLFSDKKLRLLEFAILSVVLISIIYVTIQGNRNMQIMDMEDAISQESASYGSSIVLFSGICFIAFLKYKKLLYKIIYGVAFILAVYMNFVVMQRGTNVIFTVVMVLLLFIYRKNQLKTIRLLFFVVLAFLLFLYSTGAYVAFLDYIAELLPSERVADRIRSINIFIQTGDYLEAGTSLKTRSELTTSSINTFQSSIYSFFLGVGDSRGFSDKIGDHSEIIDCLARYGILGFSILLLALISQLKFFLKLLPKENPLHYQVLIVFFVFILRNLIGNTLTAPASILLFLYMPIVCYFIAKQELIINNRKILC